MRLASWLFPLIVIAASLGCVAQSASRADLSQAKPETVGFSSERLENLHALIQSEIDRKQLAGAITLLARHGKIVDYRTYGMRDLATATPMTKDLIFRDYSMTKPVTGVAMMILYEQGKWLPTDPIAKYIPEFAHLKVFKGVDADGKMILVDPEHAPTMRELMSHSAGFSYGNGNSPVDALYKDLKPMQSASLQEMIDKLAKIPLNYEPGKGWTYSLSMDIEGYLVEKLSGKSLPDFMRDHIFTPLGMKDAGFFVPAEKRARFATNYRDNPQGELVPTADVPGPPTDYETQPPLPSGGGGLTSTIEDYYHFAQMLANGGQFNGTRVLAPSTVKLMTSNHLPAEILNGTFGIGQHIMRPGFGYGFNCAVVFDPPEANLSDGKGTFFWDGAAGTWFWVDPTNDVVFVGMIQRMTSPDNHPLLYRSHAAVYGTCGSVKINPPRNDCRIATTLPELQFKVLGLARSLPSIGPKPAMEPALNRNYGRSARDRVRSFTLQPVIVPIRASCGCLQTWLISWVCGTFGRRNRSTGRLEKG